MSRVVAILDSATGAFIDADGRVREGARYRKLAKRMLSLDKPTAVLDYGGNGAENLEVSNSGGENGEISLRAKTVKVSGQLMVGGRTLDDIVASGGSGSGLLSDIVGKEGEIVAEPIPDPEDEDRQVLQVSLDPSVSDAIDDAKSIAADVHDGKYASKEEVAALADGLYLDDASSVLDMRSVLKTLVERLLAFSGDQT